MILTHVPSEMADRLDPSTLVMMLDALNARAVRVAPCLQDSEDLGLLAEARLILLGVVKRWADAGAGGMSQMTAGPWSVTTDNRHRGYNLWPSEVAALQQLCSASVQSTAFAVDTVSTSANHQPWCAIAFGANYCSCGADLTNYEHPLHEGGALS